MTQLLYQNDEDKREERVFLAAIHGIKITDDDEEGDPKSGKSRHSSSNDGALFRDPKEYEGMSKEERKQETQKMMNKLRALGLPASVVTINKEE